MVLTGRQGGDAITLEEVARHQGVEPITLVPAIGGRMGRVWFADDRAVKMACPAGEDLPALSGERVRAYPLGVEFGGTLTDPGFPPGSGGEIRIKKVSSTPRNGTRKSR